MANHTHHTNAHTNAHAMNQLPAAALKNVLVVDDSLAICHFLSASLGAAGYATVAAANGFDAYQKAKAGHFDLVITDQNMPRMNGVELIRILRAMPDYALVPILVLTIESSPELKRMARECGASGWVVKPIGSDHIVAVAKQLLAPRLNS
jgi:two-component system chemotaxis response regulator CheY